MEKIDLNQTVHFCHECGKKLIKHRDRKFLVDGSMIQGKVILCYRCVNDLTGKAIK